MAQACVNGWPQIPHRMPVMLIVPGFPRSRILRGGTQEQTSATPLRESRSLVRGLSGLIVAPHGKKHLSGRVFL
jgi:hypothetical protein